MDGKDFKYIRHKYNLTQEDVANKIGVFRYTLSCYEKGKNEIPITKALRLSKLYNISESEIDK